MKMWMRRTRTQKLGVALVLILGGLAQPALVTADAVVDWNDIALQAITTASSPDVQSRHCARLGHGPGRRVRRRPGHRQTVRTVSRGDPGSFRLAGGGRRQGRARCAGQPLPCASHIPRRGLSQLSGQQSACGRTIPGWRWARRPLPVSSPCGPMMGRFPPNPRISSAAPIPASGARRPRSPRPCPCRGWPRSDPSPSRALDSSEPSRRP